MATRILGFVNAPSLQQRVIVDCLDAKVDLEYYDRNRKALIDGLKACGFSYVQPEGAFYLFLKSPEENDTAFCNRAKEEHILMVPGSSFGCGGYVRVAYCVAYETIQNAMPGFKRLAASYGLGA